MNPIWKLLKQGVLGSISPSFDEQLLRPHSPKAQKDSQLMQLFALSGSTGVKADQKQVDEIDPFASAMKGAHYRTTKSLHSDDDFDDIVLHWQKNTALFVDKKQRSVFKTVSELRILRKLNCTKANIEKKYEKVWERMKNYKKYDKGCVIMIKQETLYYLAFSWKWIIAISKDCFPDVQNK